MRGGLDLQPSNFQNRQNQPAYFLTGLIFQSQIQSAEVGESRNVNTYVLQDNANLVKGRHILSFGYPRDPGKLTQPLKAGGRKPLDEVRFVRTSTYPS